MLAKATVVVERVGRRVTVTIQPSSGWESALEEVWDFEGFCEWSKNNLLPKDVSIDNDRDEPLTLEGPRHQGPGLVLSPKALWWAIDRKTSRTWSISCKTLMQAHDTFERVCSAMSEIMNKIVETVQDAIDKDMHEKTEHTFTLNIRNL